MYGSSFRQPSNNGCSRRKRTVRVIEEDLHYARKREERYWDTSEREGIREEIDTLLTELEQIKGSKQ